MIEAVNSVISNAPLLRGNVAQLAASRSVAEEISPVADGPQAPFISPYISIDLNVNKAVIQIRDSETGDVVRQFPSESTLQQRQRAETARSTAEALSVQAQLRSTPGEDSASTATVSVAAPRVETPTPVPVERSAPVQAQVAAAALGAGAQAAQPSTESVNVEA